MLGFRQTPGKIRQKRILQWQLALSYWQYYMCNMWMLLHSAYPIYECYILGRKQTSVLKSHKDMEVSLKAQLQTSSCLFQGLGLQIAREIPIYFPFLRMVTSISRALFMMNIEFPDGYIGMGLFRHQPNSRNCTETSQQKLATAENGPQRNERYEGTLQRGFMNIIRWLTEQNKGQKWKQILFSTLKYLEKNLTL